MNAGMAVAVRPEEQDAVNAYTRRHAADLQKIARWGHTMEGKFRSPWYDAYCLLPGATPRYIARELDMDPKGAVGKMFNPVVLARMMKEKAKPPVWEGRAIEIDGVLHISQQDHGPLKLWFNPGLDNEAPKGLYVASADIATGAGQKTHSNSALLAGDVRTGEQVFEYTDHEISESRFGRLAVAVCNWLHGAKLIWEAQGSVGGRFANEVEKVLCYTNVWLRPKDTSIFSKELSQKAGWVNNRTRNKSDLFDDLWMACDEDNFIPRSLDFLKECGGWEWDERNKNKIIYRGTGHGDRAISGGMLWKVMKDFQKNGIDNLEEYPQDEVKSGTMAGRLQERRAAENQDEYDDFAGFHREMAGAY
jgi:hypothetical protein